MRVLDPSDRVEFDVSPRRALYRSAETSGARCADAAPMSSTCASAVLRLRGLPFVAVMKAADFWNRDDRPSGRDRDGPGIRRILLESQMRATSMIVPAVEREDALQMRLVEDDHVIQAFATD